MKTKRIKGVVKLSELLLAKTLYFYDYFEQCVVRTEPNGDGDVNYWIKFKGGVEFRGSTANDIIYETVHLNSLSITKKDYDEY